ncbi:MAG: hypothetical protein JKY48_20485 [Flavobacteriales bacterium]|nr:hypothetical protein [Flavobacteriales bacterium]
MRKIALLLCIMLSGAILFAQNISEQLFNLPHVIFKKIETPLNYEAAYELKIKQALDHENPEKGYFYQRAYLSHTGFDKPIVMVTNGYSKTKNTITEPAELLGANQINIEHRYFGESIPDSIDYQYLNLEQVAGDLHYINQIFREIYSGKWISTGISKGGQTTIFYRYAFPKDVDVSIPYVAPSTEGLEDKRIYTFLDTVGSEQCRNQLKMVQKRLLTEREKVLKLMKWYTYGAKLNFSYLTFEEAFEYTVLEYPFSFWQWGSDCASIPSKEASIEDILYHFVSISGIDFFADQGMTDYASHYYQAGSQMGYYGYDISEFKNLLTALPNNKNPSAVFMPNKMQVDFDNSSMVKMQKWLKSNGNKIIYINGNDDTWSVTSERPVKGIDALWFFLRGKDHRAARIKNMTTKERELMIHALERWLDIEIE